MTAQEPYTFNLDAPHTWENFSAPYLNPRYVRELTQVAGLNVFSEPNLIFEWGGSAREAVDGKSELKHYLCTTPPTLVRTQLPSGLHAMVNITTDIGDPRWFVARWLPPQVAGAAQFPRGRYVFFMRIAGIGDRYEEINDFWMERIRQHWQYTLNLSAAEYAETIKSVTASPEITEELVHSS